ncbi:hypothetical protein [Rhodohalobacter mucosus]|uniref:Lipoprotein n=1 Tax=Rhodohalobacter mucosus TaxID=2079485 RepID=A0A316TU00_9BACT|nr:hypothetical protein [Rhodohalobacter mucosus]PWN06809.1 hypothetical protein DDZ15_05925 [Rhodohalobacter mucosus]
MIRLATYRQLILWSLLMTAFLISCMPQMSVFNEAAYRQAVELKVASLNLLDKASTPYAENREQVETLKLELLKAWEYAKGRPDNETSAEQWEILIDPERNRLGNFFVRWEERERLSPAIVREYRLIISDTFDMIISLESGKLKPEEVIQQSPVIQ